MAAPTLWLLARHYPPAVSGGARRPFLLAKGLRERGWDVRVIAPSLPEGEAGLVAPHPNRDPATAPGAGGFSLRNTAREILLWPDADIRWCMRAARAATAGLPKPDWIMTTSPPESIHCAGLWLKRRTGARWLADFRDHWLERPLRSERERWWRRAGEQVIARRLLRAADAITTVDPVIAAEMRRLGARSPYVLPHFAPPPVNAEALPAETINVVHTGSISISDPQRRLGALLEPLERAAPQNPQLRFHFIGRLSDEEQRALGASPARGQIVLHGVIPFERSLAIQTGADALIFVGAPQMHVPPGKIVEYLALDKPIIACGEGAWRADPRVPKGDPADALATLRKGQSGNPSLPRPPTAAAAAAQLAAILGQ
ncbi:MAG TPA: glycosyltransferase [Caulobacterales bacterium]|nr:glycosyltransferase [Caulobacterales bacterium]